MIFLIEVNAFSGFYPSHGLPIQPDMPVAELIDDDLQSIDSSAKKDNDSETGSFETSSGYKLLSSFELPSWVNDNVYLPNFHRPIIPSLKKCLRSVFRIHTETGNIWTHLLGFIFFAVAVVYFYKYIGAVELRIVQSRQAIRKNIEHLKLNYEQLKTSLSFMEHFALAVFFISGMVCLTASTIYHTFLCHSYELQTVLRKVDHVGIVVLMVGSCIPPFYFGFYCQKFWQVFYFTALFALATLHVTLLLFANLSHVTRAFSYLIMGIVIATPAFHFLLLNGWQQSTENIQIDLLILMGITYAAGMLLYTFKVPERFLPDRFNIWFQSHQLFHILVVIALFIHMRAIYNIVILRLTTDSRVC